MSVSLALDFVFLKCYVIRIFSLLVFFKSLFNFSKKKVKVEEFNSNLQVLRFQLKYTCQWNFPNGDFDIGSLLKENQITAVLEVNLPHTSYGTQVISWALCIGRQLDQLMWEHTEQMSCVQIHLLMLVLWNSLLWAKSWGMSLAAIHNGVTCCLGAWHQVS